MKLLKLVIELWRWILGTSTVNSHIPSVVVCVDFQVSQGCQPSLKLFGSDAESGHVIEFKVRRNSSFSR